MIVSAVPTYSGKHILSFVLVAAVVGFASPAFAERVRLSGTHTKDEVNKACDGLANGIKVAGPDGKGYGCYNEDNGVLVACSDNGVCTGYIPREQIPPESRIDDFLKLKGPAKDGTGKRQPVDPFSLSEGVR